MYLNDILAHKKVEVAASQCARPLKTLLPKIDSAPQVRSFTQALRTPNRRIGLIAEVKKASPSVGVIRPDFDYRKIAQEYSAAGADCLSVLTDEEFFQGRLSYLTEIREVVDIPILRKDFIVDMYQIYEARAAGADAILLIVAALTLPELVSFYKLANELLMDVLVETHSRDEMEVAASMGALLIGINSRDLKTFATNLSIVGELAPLAPVGSLLVAESAIRTADDVTRVASSGADAILIGETLMRSSNITNAIEDLLH